MSPQSFSLAEPVLNVADPVGRSGRCESIYLREKQA